MAFTYTNAAALSGPTYADRDAFWTTYAQDTAGITQIGDTVTLRANVRAPAADTVTLRANVRAALADTINPRWAVRTRISDQWSAQWTVRLKVGQQRQALWLTRAAAGKTSTERWNTLLRVFDIFSQLWNVQRPLQRMAPVSVALDEGWTAVASLWGDVDEGPSPNDADYVRSVAAV
jgi:hypothetical protein